MNDPSMPGAGYRYELDARLAVLRANPLSWQESLTDSVGQLLNAAVTTLPAVRAELWQYEGGQLRVLAQCRASAAGAALVLGDRTVAPPPAYAATLADLRIVISANPAAPFDPAAPASDPAAVAHLPVSVGGALWGVLVLTRAEGPWSALDLSRAKRVVALLVQRLQVERTELAEGRFQALAESASIGILQWDESGKVLYSNHHLAELLGRTTTHWAPEFWSSFITTEYGRDLGRALGGVQNNRSMEIPISISRPDGSVRHALMMVVVVPSAPGMAKSFMSLVLDMTSQKEAQQALHELTARQRAILDNAAHAIVAMDLDGRITLFNRAAECLLGYRAEEMLGCRSVILHTEAELEAYRQELRQEMRPGSAGVVDKIQREGPQEREWNLVRKDGSHVPVMTAVTLLQGAQHEPLGLMNIITDLTERKRLAALEQREQTLINHISRGASAVVGEQFFDHLIHELRQATAAHFADAVMLRSDLDGLKGELLNQPDDPLLKDFSVVNFENAPLDPVLREGRRIHLLNALQDYPDNASVRAYKLEELIAVPLHSSKGAVFGALVVAHSGRLPESELATHLLDIFAVRASAELERLQNERALRTREVEQYWLYSASEQIHAQQDVDSVARAAADAGARHHSAPWVTVSVSEPDSNRVLAYAGPPEHAPILTTLPRTLGIYDKAHADRNEVLLIPDFQAATQGTLLHDEIVARGIREVALIGLLDDGRDIGSINFSYNDPSKLSQLDAQTLTTFGRSVSLALGRARHRQSLEYRAEHDSLTGLYNRTVLHREFARWHAAGGQSTALLLLDLDRFKEVNDTFGHHVGDALLRQIGERLRTGLNYHASTLARLGGDEFAILLRDTSISEAQVRMLANNLLQALRLPFVVEGAPLEISASVGVALYPEHGADSHALLRSADVAMYKAKQNGGGVTLYDHQFDFNTPERLALLGEFNHGLRNHELVLFYQPKIDLRTRQVVGFEALMRWQHPRLGLLAPDQFLPLVEMTDSIHALTQTVLEIACAQLQVWISAGETWSVAVNLSARNLIDDRIVHYVIGLLRRYQIPAGRLELEITETALIQDPAHALELLIQIAELGVTLSIDDFGTGYSSLAYLRDMPISTLKIDRTFVRDLLINPQDQLIARSIIQLAQSLELNVIAEGVETAEVLTRLLAMGCDQAQGYCFSRPLPLPELQRWLLEWQESCVSVWPES